jgi:hypothetical protein
MNEKQSEVVRRRRTRAEIEKLVAEYEASGLRRQAFCEKHKLTLSTLNRHRNGKQGPRESGVPSRLIPVEISERKQLEASEPKRELLIWLESGRRIEVRGGFDAKVLEQLVSVLERV